MEAAARRLASTGTRGAAHKTAGPQIKGDRLLFARASVLAKSCLSHFFAVMSARREDDSMGHSGGRRDLRRLRPGAQARPFMSGHRHRVAVTRTWRGVRPAPPARLLRHGRPARGAV